MKELELTAKDMAGRDTAKDRVRRYDMAQPKKITELEKMVGIFEGQPAVQKTGPKKNKVGKARNMGAVVRVAIE